MTDHRCDASAAQASETANETLPAPWRNAFARATATAGRRAVGADDERSRAFARQGEGDRSGAGADVGDRGGRVGGDHPEDGFDEVFGLRARYERVRRDGEVERPELLVPGEVGDRLACAPSAHQRIEAPRGGGVEGSAGVGEQSGAAPSEHVRQQDVRIEPGRRADRLQRVARPHERPGDGNDPAAGRRRRAHHSSRVGPAPATRVWRIRRRPAVGVVARPAMQQAAVVPDHGVAGPPLVRVGVLGARLRVRAGRRGACGSRFPTSPRWTGRGSRRSSSSGRFPGSRAPACARWAAARRRGRDRPGPPGCGRRRSRESRGADRSSLSMSAGSFAQALRMLAKPVPPPSPGTS